MSTNNGRVLLGDAVDNRADGSTNPVHRQFAEGTEYYSHNKCRRIAPYPKLSAMFPNSEINMNEVGE